MLDTLKHYKVFAKFVEWMLPNHRMRNNKFFNFNERRDIPDRELISLLVEFCDSEGYYIEISTHLTGGECLFSYSIWNVKQLTKSIVNDSFISTRTEATKEAILRVFQLMEKE